MLKNVPVFFLACNHNFNILSAPHQRGSKKEGTGREKILYFSYSKWMICSNHINTSRLKPRVKSSTLLITALKAHVYLRFAAAWRLSLLAQLEQLALIACQHKQKQGADGNLTWLKLCVMWRMFFSLRPITGAVLENCIENKKKYLTGDWTYHTSICVSQVNINQSDKWTMWHGRRALPAKLVGKCNS